MFHRTPLTVLALLASTAFSLPASTNSTLNGPNHHPSSSSSPSPSASATSTSSAPSTTVTCGPDPGAFDPALFLKLTQTPTAAERDVLLAGTNEVFSFADPCHVAGVTAGNGGKTVRADRATFPSLFGSGASMTLGFLDACGFNTPHVHPRAAELNIVVQGRLFGSVTAENGAPHRNHTLNQFDMTVFPEGAIHTEFNPDCTPAVFVAAFPNEDPGVGQIAQGYFGLEDEIIKASIGGDVTVDGRDIDAFRSLIPANVAVGVDSCLAKCGIKKR